MKNSTVLKRIEGAISGTVICPYCGESITFVEDINGTATVVGVGRNSNTRLYTGEKFTEERIGLELNVKCDTCGYAFRSTGDLINEL